MAHVWLTKRMLSEALEMLGDSPSSAIVEFEGNSEVIDGTEYTVMCICAGGLKKTVREDFQKVLSVNDF